MFCPNCGNQVNEGAFCPVCGAALAQQQAAPQQQAQPAPAAYGFPKELLEVKNIAVCIILSIVTCGIYALIWYYNMMKKVRLVYEGNADVTGEFLLFILVPFYSWYWIYTRSKRLAEGANRIGVPLEDQSTLNIILVILGLGIVAVALIQDQLNKIARAYGAQ